MSGRHTSYRRKFMLSRFAGWGSTDSVKAVCVGGGACRGGGFARVDVGGMRSKKSDDEGEPE